MKEFRALNERAADLAEWIADGACDTDNGELVDDSMVAYNAFTMGHYTGEYASALSIARRYARRWPAGDGQAVIDYADALRDYAQAILDAVEAKS